MPSLAAPAIAWIRGEGGLTLARFMLLGMFVTMLVSTSLAIGFEFASYFVFACVPELRGRLSALLRHPLTVGYLPFAAVILIATFYGPVSWHDAFSSLIGWRRLLLLPLCLAVFDDEASKRLVLKVVIATCVLGAIVSFIGIWVQPENLLTFGIVFHNYATQGMTFSLAIIACAAALLRPEAFAGDPMLGDRRIMAAALIVLAVDLVFVLVGRSGYLSIIIMAVVLVATLVDGSRRVKASAGLGVLMCVGLLLFSSENVRERFSEAIHEIASVDETATGTSVGQRIVMWRTTVRMIRDHPVFGVGTGGFQEGYRPYVRDVAGWQSFESADPHNQFLKIQGEQGLVGLLAFLFFIARVLACPGSVPYRQLAVAALIGWCATSLANSHFSTFVEGRLLFFWLGAMLATQTSVKPS
jgi:O-antigen ligase